MTELKQALTKLCSRLQARSENAYLEMIGAARKDEALGWEIKVEHGIFGRPELDAHSAIARQLEKHRTLADVCLELNELLKLE